MNAGDMVRYRESNEAAWKLGILVEYEKWMKVAEILADGKMYRVHASFVQLHERHPDNIEMLKKLCKGGKHSET